MSIREQAQAIVRDRLERLINNYPEDISKLTWGEKMARLDEYHGKEFMDALLDESAVEKQLKKRRTISVLGIAFLIIGLVAWGDLQVVKIVGALPIANGSLNVWLPTVATGIVTVVWIWLIVRSIRAITRNKWKKSF